MSIHKGDFGSVETMVKLHLLSVHVWEWWYFVKPFSDWRYLVAFRRYAQQVTKLPKIWCFGPQNFRQKGPQISDLFINLFHRQTCGRVWWQSAKQRPRLGSEKRKRSNHQLKTEWAWPTELPGGHN